MNGHMIHVLSKNQNSIKCSLYIGIHLSIAQTYRVAFNPQSLAYTFIKNWREPPTYYQRSLPQNNVLYLPWYHEKHFCATILDLYDIAVDLDVPADLLARLADEI